MKNKFGVMIAVCAVLIASFILGGSEGLAKDGEETRVKTAAETNEIMDGLMRERKENLLKMVRGESSEVNLAISDKDAEGEEASLARQPIKKVKPNRKAKAMSGIKVEYKDGGQRSGIKVSR